QMANAGASPISRPKNVAGEPSGSSAVSRAVDRRRPGWRRGAKGDPPAVSLRGHDVRDKHQNRELDSGSRRRLEGGRGRDRIGHVVEIVVIPVPPDPGRVRGIRERGRREPDEQGNDDQYEDATGNEHGWIIAPLCGVVKIRG